MTAEFPMTDPFSPPVASDGLALKRELSRDDLEQILAALTDFKKALAEWEQRREHERTVAGRKLTPGQEMPGGHLTVAGETADAGASEARPETSTGEAGSSTAPAPEAFHCLVVAGYLGGGYGPAGEMSTEDAVADACAQHFGADPSSPFNGYPFSPQLERIHVILESGGGSLDSAFKTMLFLRRFAQEVRVYVPSRAKSAATLIAVGADRIVMSPYAELGPLDTQIKDPRNPATYVSALDCYRSVDYVREFGVYTISRALKVMLAETQAMVSLSEVIATATEFAVGSVRPMLEQVKALDFGAWGRTLKIGETYAKSLRLRLRHPDSLEVAERIARKLVYGYTHHPYPIDRVEAEELGLTVDMMPKDVYVAARRIAGACKGEARFVGFSEDVRQAVAELSELQDGTPRTGSLAAAGARPDDGAVANVVQEPEWRTGHRGPVQEPEWRTGREGDEPWQTQPPDR